MTKKTRRAKARRALLALSLVLVTMLVTVGGTIAWLTAESDTVTNTFSPSDITVSLEENGATEVTEGEWAQDFQIIPGKDIVKVPTVSASADVDYYVFVKVIETNWIDGLTYSVDDSAWTPVDGHAGVYYQAMSANTALTDETILATLTDSTATVEVSEELTKADMEAIGTNKPTLTFEAYAIQQEGFTSVADAWEEVSGN